VGRASPARTAEVCGIAPVSGTNPKSPMSERITAESGSSVPHSTATTSMPRTETATRTARQSSELPLLRFEDEPESLSFFDFEPESESESPPLLRELPESESEPPPLRFFDEPDSESLSLSPPDFFLDEPESESLSFLRLEPESEPPLRLRELPPESESPPLLRDEPESASLSLLLLLLRSVSSSAMRSHLSYVLDQSVFSCRRLGPGPGTRGDQTRERPVNQADPPGTLPRSC
jgi:hypothetical protein